MIGLRRGRGGGFVLGRGRGILAGTQHDPPLFLMCLHTARHLALGDAGKHLGVRGRRLGAEISVVRGQIPKYSAIAFMVSNESSNPSSVQEKVP